MLYLNQFSKPVFISILFFALLAFSSSVAKSWLLVNGTDKTDEVDLRDLVFGYCKRRTICVMENPLFDLLKLLCNWQ